MLVYSKSRQISSFVRNNLLLKKMLLKKMKFSSLFCLLMAPGAKSFTFPLRQQMSTTNKTGVGPVTKPWSMPRPRDILYSSASSSSSAVASEIYSLSLEKPLGMILEEVEEGGGVIVKELSEGGSAFASDMRNQLVGCRLLTVMGKDVSSMPFDNVMEQIIDAPSPVKLEVKLPSEYSIGTSVTVTVMQDSKPNVDIECVVGDNLRTTLLANNIELYKGLKKKLGNCGGGGQCTFCAVEFVDQQGWEERSDYEDKKLAKQGSNVRLACLNNIQGPCTVRIS